MFIRRGNKHIEIQDPIQAINLEIKFNLTPNGKVWSRIGDALFYFKDIEVDTGQFNYMLELVTNNLDSSNFSVVL